MQVFLQTETLYILPVIAKEAMVAEIFIFQENYLMANGAYQLIWVKNKYSLR
jgi:hypothetical protein